MKFSHIFFSNLVKGRTYMFYFSQTFLNIKIFSINLCKFKYELSNVYPSPNIHVGLNKSFIIPPNSEKDFFGKFVILLTQQI